MHDPRERTMNLKGWKLSHSKQVQTGAEFTDSGYLLRPLVNDTCNIIWGYYHHSDADKVYLRLISQPF